MLRFEGDPAAEPDIAWICQRRPFFAPSIGLLVSFSVGVFSWSVVMDSGAQGPILELVRLEAVIVFRVYPSPQKRPCRSLE